MGEGGATFPSVGSLENVSFAFRSIQLAAPLVNVGGEVGVAGVLHSLDFDVLAAVTHNLSSLPHAAGG